MALIRSDGDETTQSHVLGLAVVLGVFAIDQGLKYAILAHLEPGQSKWLLRGVVSLRHVRNTSGAFGAFSGLAESVRTILFAVLPLATLGAIVWTVRHLNLRYRPAVLGIALVVGGAASNLLDRFVRGAVIDFVCFFTRHSVAPTYNFADAAIIAGTVLTLKALVMLPRARS